MHIIVDTNVPVVANGTSEQASPLCIHTCRLQLDQIVHGESILVIDKDWRILREYTKSNLSSGAPGVGNKFLKWVLINKDNPQRCEQVPITLKSNAQHADDFCEFPNDADLAHFDRSDRKFVAVALTHTDKPPVFNAVDSDWWHYRQPLAAHGVRVEFLCPDAMPL